MEHNGINAKSMRIFGVEIFTYDHCELIDDHHVFFNPKYCLEELKKFDGLLIDLSFELKISVWGKDRKLVSEFNLIDISSFRNELKKCLEKY